MPETKELPPKYYLDYFRYLLRFVREKYAGLLHPHEREFLDEFDRLDEAAQSLFVRFSNRRGAFFRVRKLNYPEIEHWGAALKQLEERGFAERIGPWQGERAGELLDVFTKPELLEFARLLNLDVRGKSALKKPEVIDFLLENAPFADLIEAIEATEPVVKVCHEEEVMLMKYLFFGTRSQDMTDFVVRDLGLLRFEAVDESQLVARFSTRKEVDDKLAVSVAREDFRLMRETEVEPLRVYYWFMDWNARKGDLEDIARSSYDRLVLRVAGFLERKKMWEESLTVFRLTAAPPSRERQVRLLVKLKSTEEALALCDQILQAPQNADEQFFAIDFINGQTEKLKKRRAKRSVTSYLHQSESLVVAPEFRYQVERGVAEALARQGWQVTFSENYLWRGLFGLLFWDVIFDAGAAALHHPLQRSPSDLYQPRFFEKRREALLDRLDLLDQPEALRRHLTAVFTEKAGTVNSLVDWFPDLLPMVLTACQRVPAEALRKVLLDMMRNLREHTRGFPDLFAWTDADYCFVEVKSPTDNLSSQQLYWLRFFAANGLKSKVLRVEWDLPQPVAYGETAGEELLKSE
jgi:hypothetical protein